MKDLIKIVLFFLIGLAVFLGLSLLSFLGPFLIMMLRIVIAVAIIGGGILLFRNKWTHRLPKDKEREHRDEYKRQFHKS